MNRIHTCIVSVQKYEPIPLKNQKNGGVPFPVLLLIKYVCWFVFKIQSEISVQALLYYNSFNKRIMMIVVSSYWFVQLKRRER